MIKEGIFTVLETLTDSVHMKELQGNG